MFYYALKTFDTDNVSFSHSPFVSFDNINYQMLRDIDFSKILNINESFIEFHLIKMYDINLYPLSRLNYSTICKFTFEITSSDINDVKINKKKIFTQTKQIDNYTNCTFNIYLHHYINNNNDIFVFEFPYFSFKLI